MRLWSLLAMILLVAALPVGCGSSGTTSGEDADAALENAEVGIEEGTEADGEPGEDTKTELVPDKDQEAGDDADVQPDGEVCTDCELPPPDGEVCADCEVGDHDANPDPDEVEVCTDCEDGGNPDPDTEVCQGPGCEDVKETGDGTDGGGDACDCSGQPNAPVCGLKSTDEGVKYTTYDNPCLMECDGAEVANCAAYGVVKVCDLASMTTYDNACYAGCQGVDLAPENLKAGECSCAMTCEDWELEPSEWCSADCVNYTSLCALKCAGVTQGYTPGLCDAYCGTCETCWGVFLDPVCGTDNQTHSSLCELQNAECLVGPAELSYPGQCVPETQCACTHQPTDVPVCGERQDAGWDYSTLNGMLHVTWQTYANQCVASCKGAQVYFQYVCGECDPSPDAPACGKNAITKKWEAIRNPCVAESIPAKYSKWYAGDCVTCPDTSTCDLSVYDPVCGSDGITYINQCELDCAGGGATVAYPGECACPDTYEPVCGKSIYSGLLNTYGNACVAKTVFGVSEFTPGACDNCAVCDQPENDFGVGCGWDGVTYPNYCVYQKCNSDKSDAEHFPGMNDLKCTNVCASCGG